MSLFGNQLNRFCALAPSTTLKVLAVGLCAFIVGCESAKPVGNELVGRPSWVPLGPNVVHETDVDPAARSILSFGMDPEWFDSKDYTQSKRFESDAWVLSNKGQPPLRMFKVLYPYPQKVEEVPVENQGVRLKLDAQSDHTSTVVTLSLKLASNEKPLVREMMQRYTNTLPFLFAVYVDQVAVTINKSKDHTLYGDTLYLAPLVQAGQTRIWNLKVDSTTLESFLPDSSPHHVTLVAVFSSRQHYPFCVQEKDWDLDFFNQIEPEVPGTIGGPRSQVLVRSNAINLEWTGADWVVPKQDAH